MYPPSIERENVLARQNEILQAAEQYHRAKKFSDSRTFRWPKLSNFFSSRKAEKQTTALTQAQ